MKSIPATSFLALALVLIPPSVALGAEAEDTLEKTFTASPGGRFALEADRGTIEVGGTDEDSVKVVVARKATASSADKARALLESHQVKFSQEGERVSVTARSPREAFSGGSRHRLEVRFKVSVPRRHQLELGTAGGSVVVSEIEGTVTARTSGGSLKFERINGPITGRSSGGSISASHCQGKVDVSTGGGSISVTDLDGEVKAETSGGSVSARQVGGPAHLRTSGGSIELDAVGVGVEARTSGGSIEAHFPVAPSRDCHLETSGGSITLAVPKEAELAVDLRTSGGRVVTEIPVTMVVLGEKRPHVIEGTLNGGGPKITAHTSGGNVRLKASR